MVSIPIHEYSTRKYDLWCLTCQSAGQFPSYPNFLSFPGHRQLLTSRLLFPIEADLLCARNEHSVDQNYPSPQPPLTACGGRWTEQLLCPLACASIKPSLDWDWGHPLPYQFVGNSVVAFSLSRSTTCFVLFLIFFCSVRVPGNKYFASIRYPVPRTRRSHSSRA